ncbi:MAG: D-alanine--D-alanine ligase A, partial [Rhodothermaeota bacterium MED-G18]
KLKLKGFTRSDFIFQNNKFYFLEVNTNPGLTAESILPQQAEAAGIDLKELFESVLN